MCLAPLTETTAFVVPEAFTDPGRAKVGAVFERVIGVPVEEATGGPACDCHCVDGEYVRVGKGNPGTERRLADVGLVPAPVPTGEFREADGWVRCLDSTSVRREAARQGDRAEPRNRGVQILPGGTPRR